MQIEQELKLLKEENERLKKMLRLQESVHLEPSIENLIEIDVLKEIFEKFSALTGYTAGFIKQDTREVLISTGWTDICKNFHRASESSAYICQESNADLTKNLQETHQISMKECKHGMVDGATPIIIDGKHLADLFSGQVLLHKPDLEEFRLGAKEFGYDTKAYLKAVEEVKIISKEKLHDVLDYLSSVAKVIAELGKDKKEFLKLNASLEEQVIKRTEEQNRLLSLFDHSDTVLFKWKNDEKWSVDYVSKSIENLLGISKKDFEEEKILFSSLIHPDDAEYFIKEIKRAVEEGKMFFSHKPYRVKTSDNNYKWILDNTVISRDEFGNVIHFLGYLNDITELKEYQERLKKLSITDQLTKVYNRLYIDKLLQKQHYRFIRNCERCSVILIDIDYFKKINDSYGHAIGDTVLIEFVQVILENIRESDTLGRWGGEEFLIISPHTNKEEATHLAEKIRKKIAQYDFTSVKKVTACFGVSEFTQERRELKSLFESVDKALYRAKESGRNRVVS